jgi:hypothetical protein
MMAGDLFNYPYKYLILIIPKFFKKIHKSLCKLHPTFVIYQNGTTKTAASKSGAGKTNGEILRRYGGFHPCIAPS